MSETSERILVELLIKAGHFTRDQYEAVLKTRRVHETSIRFLITEKGLVKETDIIKVLHESQNFDVADVTHQQIPEEILSRVSVVQAVSYGIFPLRQEGDDIVLGMVDVLDSNLLDDLRFAFDFSFKIELLTPQDHKTLVERCYGEQTDKMENAAESLTGPMFQDDGVFEEMDPKVNDAPVVKLLNSILFQAIQDHASDIHFEPFEEEFKIRYRIDGTLYEMIPPPRSLAEYVLSRIKVMARMNIAEKRVPQDGRITLRIKQKTIDLRVSTIPTAFGESAVIRILDRSHVQLDLNTLGMNRDLLTRIRNVIHKPNGIFITTGPTSAGKTTTTYSCLREINTVDSKIITTEDPVEYDIEGIIQVQINDDIGLTFASCLRSILRQDPDKIMVGEIRDLDTMNMAIQASLTGHLVLTTLHTNDSASAITRLIDMGVEPFLICSSLEAILAQRLVRIICTQCKEAYKPHEGMLKLVGIDPKKIGKKKFYRGKGCEACGGIGYTGRTGIFELLTINHEIRDLIMQRSTSRMIKSVGRRHGLISLMEDGIQKIEAGVTTVEEVAACATEG